MTIEVGDLIAVSNKCSNEDCSVCLSATLKNPGQVLHIDNEAPNFGIVSFAGNNGRRYREEPWNLTVVKKGEKGEVEPQKENMAEVWF